jgi:hypothetical protein
MPENIQLWRWMSADDKNYGMIKQFIDAKPSMVFQHANSMCASFVNSGYSSENEITTLPDTHFVVVELKKGIPGNLEGGYVDVVMLPPYQGYVAELAKMSKSFLGGWYGR